MVHAVTFSPLLIGFLCAIFTTAIVVKAEDVILTIESSFLLTSPLLFNEDDHKLLNESFKLFVTEITSEVGLEIERNTNGNVKEDDIVLVAESIKLQDELQNCPWGANKYDYCETVFYEYDVLVRNVEDEGTKNYIQQRYEEITDIALHDGTLDEITAGLNPEQPMYVYDFEPITDGAGDGDTNRRYTKSPSVEPTLSPSPRATEEEEPFDGLSWKWRLIIIGGILLLLLLCLILICCLCCCCKKKKKTSDPPPHTETKKKARGIYNDEESYSEDTTETRRIQDSSTNHDISTRDLEAIEYPTPSTKHSNNRMLTPYTNKTSTRNVNNNGMLVPYQQEESKKKNTKNKKSNKQNNKQELPAIEYYKQDSKTTSRALTLR